MWTITGYDSTTSGHSASAWTGETGTSYKNLTATVTFTATWLHRQLRTGIKEVALIIQLPVFLCYT